MMRFAVLTIFALLHARNATAASFGHIKIKPTKIESLTETEDWGDDEISVWIGDHPINQEENRGCLHKANTNYYKQVIGKGESHSLTGSKSSDINSGKAVYIHLGEHDILEGDITEYGNITGFNTPEIPADTVDKWLVAFNEGVFDKITISELFKFDTFGRDDLPFASEIAKLGFPGWVADLAFGSLCVDALDVVLTAVGGPIATKAGVQVTAAMARQGYKETSKTLARYAIEEATEQTVDKMGRQIAAVEVFGASMNGVLDKTEFCLFPDLAKGNSDAVYRVTFEVTPGEGVGRNVAGGAENVSISCDTSAASFEVHFPVVAVLFLSVMHVIL